MSKKTTVKELLNTPYLKGLCTVVAGEKGLDRQVTWVHILEVHDIASQYVDGGELVLVTSKEFADKKVALRFLSELIEKDIAAVCIDTTLYYPQIDEELIQLANRYDLPVIQLYQFTRFIDISRGLNTLILSEKSVLFQNAERYDAALAAIAGSAAFTEKIRYTTEYLNLEAAYLPVEGTAYYTSAEIENHMKENLRRESLIGLKENEVLQQGNLIVKGLFVFHRVYGYLAFFSDKGPLTDFEEMIFSRLAINLRNTQINEMKEKELLLIQHHDWIEKWLAGELEEEKIKANLKKMGYIEDFSQFYVCSILAHKKTPSEIEERKSEKPEEYAMLDTFLAGISVVFRKAYEEENLIALTYVKDPVITYIIAGKKTDTDLKRRIEKAVRKLQEGENPYIDFRKSVFSVGRKVSDYTQVKRSMETAAQMLEARELAKDGLIFFDELYIKEIFRAVDSQGILDRFISDTLDALLLPENRILFQTLKTYYDCNCSKQKTAADLYVARQTLYPRLKKIEDILGEGFDEGERRLACEFAIHAHLYMQSKE